jgi:hypothetical protein
VSPGLPYLEPSHMIVIIITIMILSKNVLQKLPVITINIFLKSRFYWSG